MFLPGFIGLLVSKNLGKGVCEKLSLYFTFFPKRKFSGPIAAKSRV